MNYIIREIMKHLVNIGALEEDTYKNALPDFPLPSTKSSLQNLKRYWTDLAASVGIPTEQPPKLKQATLFDMGLEMDKVEAIGQLC